MNLSQPATRRGLRRSFVSRFGGPQTGLRCALAPGRVNLIGEHTDYNGGLVLPMAIDRHTAVVFRPNARKRLCVWSDAAASAGWHPEDEFALGTKTIPRAQNARLHWSNYVRGVAAALQRRGIRLKGGDLFITGDLPQGAGLSSSASIEVATALALLALAGRRGLEPKELAFVAQEAEHRYAGVRCGIMDQTVVVRGRAGHALLLDCKSLAVRHVPIRLNSLAFALFDTGVRHKLASSEYNKRRAECERAARIFRVPTLRDSTLAQLLQHGPRLTSSEHRRVRHVLGEDLRTAQFAAALAHGDGQALGRLLDLSHQSLASDYEVSCPELDFLAAELRSKSSCLGARMTGGGFGGAVVALIKAQAFNSLRKQIQSPYRRRFGRKPGDALMVRPGGGARVVVL